MTGASGAEERLGGFLFDREPIGAASEPAQDVVGVLVGPIREHEHLFAVDARQIGTSGGVGFWLDHDAAVNGALLLQARVAVVPVGAGVFE